MKVKKGSVNHINLHKIAIKDHSFDPQKLEDYYKAGFIDITATNRCLEILEELGSDFEVGEVKFGSAEYIVLKELKVLGFYFYYHSLFTIGNLIHRGYILVNTITQKGLDKLETIEKDKNWCERSLILTLVYFTSNVYRLHAVELGLLIWQDGYKLTEKGKKYLYENVNIAFSKWKYSWHHVDYLLPYVTDISILPSYLASDHKHISDAAKKRYDELKGKNK